MVFRSDPCGFVCLIITYTAIFYSDYVVVKHLIMASVLSETLWGAANAVVYNVMIFLATAAHLRAVFSDPGIVPYPSTSLDFSHMHSGQHKQERSDGWTVCMKCENYRPPRAHHCRICRRCIRRMDHHCPWINNCVGELNQRYFIQFLFYIGVLSLHAVAMVVLSWMLDPGVAGKGKQIKLIHSIVLVVESMLFGMFVLAIGCDQISSIFNDETAVEHVKKDGPRRTKRSKMVLLQEVFGRGNMCLWLWPLGMSSPVFPAERSDEYTV